MGSKKIPLAHIFLVLVVFFVALVPFGASAQGSSGNTVSAEDQAIINSQSGVFGDDYGYEYGAIYPTTVPKVGGSCPAGYHPIGGIMSTECRRNDVPGSGVTTATIGQGTNPIPATPSNEKIECEGSNLGGWPKWLSSPVTCGFYFLGTGILWIFAKFVYLSGILLDTSIHISILKIGTYFTSSISLVWSTVRDLGNILFIFFLLWISIATILGLDNAKNHLASIIIAALLVNFSFFFTKVIIDASNIVAVQFYSQMVPANCLESGGNNQIVNFNGCLSEKIMAATKLSSIYNSGREGVSGSIKLNIPNAIIITIMGSIFLLTVAFAFLIAAFMFIARTVLFVLLAAVAPIAFVGNILPATKQYAREWWKMLTDQALVAPIFLFLMWIVTMLAQTQVSGGLFGSESPGSHIDTESMARAFSGVGGSVNIIFGFLFLIMLMFFTIKITRQYSGSIGGAFVKFGTSALGSIAGGAGGMALRNTFGRAASRLAKTEVMQDWNAKNKFFLGKALYSGTQGLAKSSMDVRGAPGAIAKTGAGRLFGGALGAVGASADFGKAGGEGGYQAKLETQVKTREDFIKSIEPNKARIAAQDKIIADRRAAIATHVAIPGNSLQDAAVTALRADITAAETAKRTISAERRGEAIDETKRKKIDTLWTKTARKNKLGVRRAEIERINKEIEDFDKKAKEHREEVKRLRNKERGGTPLTGPERTDLKDAEIKQTTAESEIAARKSQIARLEADYK